ncbi:MAG: type II secretion system secretin GspD [Burkholderiaceae bacterium]
MTSWRTMVRARRGSLARTLVLVCTVAMIGNSVVPAFAQTSNRPAPAKPAEDTVMLNFVNADIDAVVRAIGQFTGRTFVIDPRVKGTLTLATERPVTRQQAYEQLLTGLRLQGFTIVQTGNVMRVVPEADAKLQGGTVVGPRAAAPGGDQLVTQVFRLQYESATAMVPILRPLIAPNNTISAYPQNNTLVITDYADNLRRIQRIIEAIDTPAGAEVEFVPIKYGLAMEIATIANRVLDESARAAGQSTDAGQRVSILAEARTNSLIIRAPSQARLKLAKNLIAELDKPASTPGNINVVYLRNAEAVRLAPLLRAIIGSDASFVGQASSGGLSAQGAAPGAPGGAQGQAGGTTIGGGTMAGGTSLGGGSSGGAGSGNLAGMIQADAATNALIITAPEPLFRNIRAIIDKLDVRRAQVVIESLIVEMTADKAAEFGIQWQALGNINDSGTNVIAGTNFGGSGTNIIGASQNIASLGQGLNLGVIRGKILIPGIGEVLNLAFLARALETMADANILSTPTIQTLDNEEAKFLVGQNIPIITGSYAAAGAGGGVAGVNPFQTFERKDIGLQLRVKPQISEGGVVRLAIYQELSSIQNTLTAAQGGIITNKRSFESTVLIEDGNIVVLGGLIEDRTENSRSSLPVLGSIPVLGALFSYENRGRKKTNLLVFLRPYVVRDEVTSSALALDRYDYIRGQVASNTAADNFIFRGLQGTQLPERPPVAPSLRRSGEPAAPASTNVPTAPSTPAATATEPATSAPTRPGAAVPEPDSRTPSSAPLTAREAPPSVTAPPASAPAAPQAEPLPSAPMPAPMIEPKTLPPNSPLPAAPTPAPSSMTSPSAPVSEAPTPLRADPPPVVATLPPSTPTSTATAPAPSASTSGASTASAAPAATGNFAAAPGVASGGTQLLQVAAVSEVPRGRELQRQLREAGFDAYWESVQTKKGDIVRVRVSVDPATQSMAATVAKLKSMGFDPIFVTP